MPNSPRSLNFEEKSLNSTQQLSSTHPRRASSSKKIDKEKEEKDKRD